MFCVIQKIKRKKPNQNGEPKEIIVDSYTWSRKSMFGELEFTKTKYTYRWSEKRFERPILDAYRISLHESYRQDGKVKKRQYYVCTMSYYDLIDYSLYDFADIKIEELAEELNIDKDEIYKMIHKKLDPIIKQVIKEFQQTDEYKTKVKHQKILDTYHKNKKEFEEKYGEGEYDYCYDVFGNLKNEVHLQTLIDFYETKQKAKSSYYTNTNSNYNNFNDYDFSSYFNLNTNNYYNEQEKNWLKKIYRLAAKNFHPDVTGDNGEMMKFLVKLKEQWGI